MSKLNLPKLIKVNPISPSSSNKPFVLIMAPVSSRSGYGEHSRDIARSVISTDKYAVKIINLNWGMTPSNVLKAGIDDDILNCIVTDTQFLQHIKPDVFIHITIPIEFVALGKYNIGITAGIESTIAKPEWVDALNRMDRIIVPSEFTKTVFTGSVFDKMDNQTQQRVGQLKLEKPIDVLFEGTNTEIFKPIEIGDFIKIKNSDLKTKLDNIKEEFLFLVVGHWLSGDLGQDRKDIGSSISLFFDAFKDYKKFNNKKQRKSSPALVIKTSGATYSVKDRDVLLQKIATIRNGIKLEKGDVLPNVYLLHSDLSDDEMNQLYNHPKIKAMFSLTKGEGYGRPLQEFAFTGKPVIVSNWSAQTDFIKPEYHTLLPGQVIQVHPSALNDFTFAESGWFTVDYQVAGDKLIDCFNLYTTYKSKSQDGIKYLTENKTLDKMKVELNNILDGVLNNAQTTLQQPNMLTLPKLKLPELK